MAFLKILLIVLASILGVSNCAFVDTLSKCQVKDKECHKNLLVKVLRESSGGIPDLGIPPVDPAHFKDLKVSILNVLDMKLIEGTAKGIKDCNVDKFDANFDTLHAYVELTCDVLINTKYEMQSSSPVLKNLLGGEVHGKGNGKVKLEKINIKMDFPFEVEKRGDDTFLKSNLKKYKYSCNVKGKMTFAADNVYLGEKESSKEVVKLINENWKLILESFGDRFFDVAMSIVYDFVQKFFSNVATKYYLVDDLTTYL